ncbi:EcKinase 4 [Frankliniella occidentalis]|uniref:Uncharacterized protein LOC113208044 n=1 Tax=Frankliniella occidentalis TaxID=133901 RepID=A0A6J1SMV1_FRAOC|nr:uncharacterized protein LOC113208044 [Frankliniella occidentalis]KAE8739877.1 EcKinase 4 [Frankliniella occidentalis]
MTANGCESVEVPPVVDKALRDVAARKGYKKPRFTVTTGSGARDGYLSTMYRAHIHDEDPTGPADMSAMCKMSMSVMESIMGDVFAAEGHIYSKVLPAMAEVAGPESTPRWPQVLDVAVDGPLPHCVTLEDFGPLGFGQPVRTKGLDVDHCRLLTQQLAKFHAAGFVLKHLHPDKYQALAAPLENLFDSQEMKDTFRPFLTGIRALPDLVTERWPVGSKTHKLITKACEAAWQDFSVMVEPASWENDGEGCCLAHGDCQNNNVAFKYDKDTGRVVDCMLYDFQIMHQSSPTLDLTRILLISTDQEMREAHLDELLRGYLRDLHAHMRAGGVQDPERVFSWDLLQKHMRRTALWASMAQPLFHNILHSDDTAVAQMRDALAKAGALEEQTEQQEIPLQVTPLLKQRFIDLIQDITDRGWMPTEEDLDKWVAREA